MNCLDKDGLTRLWSYVKAHITALNSTLADKANVSHTHDYLPLTGGSVSGDVKANKFIALPDTDDRYTEFTASGARHHVSSGTWASGFTYVDVSNTAITGIGMFGTGANISYGFFGGTWDKPWVKVYPTGELAAPKFTGALNGNAASATKLATARKINNTSFDGSGDIRLSDYYSFNFGITNSQPGYITFARTTKTNQVYATEATMIISSVGNFAGSIPGTYLVTVSNRGSVPTLTATTIRKQGSGSPVFGYYSDDNYFYFGMYTNGYSYTRNVTVLSNSGVTIYKGDPVTTAPVGWTAVTAGEYSFSTHTHDVQSSSVPYLTGRTWLNGSSVYRVDYCIRVLTTSRQYQDGFICYNDICSGLNGVTAISAQAFATYSWGAADNSYYTDNIDYWNVSAGSYGIEFQQPTSYVPDGFEGFTIYGYVEYAKDTLIPASQLTKTFS